MKWTNKGHEFDHFLSVKGIFIFGAGENGQYLYNIIKDKINVFGFIDNDIEKQKTFEGKKVYSLEEVSKLECEYLIVVATSVKNSATVISQLIKYGYDIDKNIVLMRKYLGIYLAYIEGKVYLDNCTISITEKCTLNCEKCSVLTPYLREQKHHDIEKLEKDIDILFNAIDKIGTFGLLGGEPFLHPQFSNIVEYIGVRYRKQMSNFIITTNGTVMPSDTLLNLFKKFDMTIFISDYTKALPNLKQFVRKFVDCMNKSGVKYEVLESDNWIDFGYDWVDRSSESEENLIDLFDSCKMPCRLMQDGKLYYCANSKFAINASMNEFDECNTYDISDADKVDKKIFLEFNNGYSEKGYINMCKKCNGYLSINKNYVEVAKQI